jgi:hypothetical protein
MGDLGKFLLMLLLILMAGAAAAAIVAVSFAFGGVVTVLLYKLGITVLMAFGWLQ